MEVAWKQLRMVRKKGKQVISAATAVFIAKRFSIGLKPKNPSCYTSNIRRKNSCYKKGF